MNKKNLIKKDAHFSTSEIKEGKTGREYLEIEDLFGNATISVCDSEILDRQDSPECFSIKISFVEAKDETIFFHKKEIIPLASFLLGIYNKYLMKHDEIDWLDFCEQFKDKK